VSVQRFYDALLELSGTLAGLAYGAIAVLMLADIVVRTLNIGAFGWLVELTEYTLYGATFLAAAWTLRQNAHVRIDILVTNLPRVATGVVTRAGDALGCAVSAIVGWYGMVALADAWAAKTMQYRTWAVPEWLLLVPIPLGALLLALEFGRRAMRPTGG
jgi:TRAP-type C4-dicarboxylate transport system permease small subunit